MSSTSHLAPRQAGRRRRLAAAARIALFVASVAQPMLAEGPRHAFVTSAAGTADLGSWEQAGDATGLAAGDAICRALAHDAGLTAPDAYVAFLSDSANDAYCRAHGLGGTKRDRCGQQTLPSFAGPWRRLDGLPWAGGIDEVVSTGLTATPLLLDENLDHPSGTDYANEYFWTGTDGDGVAASWGTCSGFTSANAGSTPTGARSSVAFLYVGGTACYSSRRLLCLQAGAGDALPSGAAGGRFAFATTATGSGDLASWPAAGGAVGAVGVAAGDAICRAEAVAAGLAFPESFRAWLSTSSDGPARSRFVHDGPWIRVDGLPVATGFDDLLDARIGTALAVDATGASIWPGYAWTGTTRDGQVAAVTCGDWQDGAAPALGGAGATGWANEGWTQYVDSGCQHAAHLHCLSDADPALRFADGFESGTSRYWTATSP